MSRRAVWLACALWALLSLASLLFANRTVSSAPLYTEEKLRASSLTHSFWEDSHWDQAHSRRDLASMTQKDRLQSLRNILLTVAKLNEGLDKAKVGVFLAPGPSLAGWLREEQLSTWASRHVLGLREDSCAAIRDKLALRQDFYSSLNCEKGSGRLVDQDTGFFSELQVFSPLSESDSSAGGHHHHFIGSAARDEAHELSAQQWHLLSHPATHAFSKSLLFPLKSARLGAIDVLVPRQPERMLEWRFGTCSSDSGCLPPLLTLLLQYTPDFLCLFLTLLRFFALCNLAHFWFSTCPPSRIVERALPVVVCVLHGVYSLCALFLVRAGFVVILLFLSCFLDLVLFPVVLHLWSYGQVRLRIGTTTSPEVEPFIAVRLASRTHASSRHHRAQRSAKAHRWELRQRVRMWGYVWLACTVYIAYTLWPYFQSVACHGRDNVWL